MPTLSAYSTPCIVCPSASSPQVSEHSSAPSLLLPLAFRTQCRHQANSCLRNILQHRHPKCVTSKQDRHQNTPLFGLPLNHSEHSQSSSPKHACIASRNCRKTASKLGGTRQNAAVRLTEEGTELFRMLFPSKKTIGSTRGVQKK